MGNFLFSFQGSVKDSNCLQKQPIFQVINLLNLTNGFDGFSAIKMFQIRLL